MTTLAYPAGPAHRALPHRVWNAVRLHTANPWPTLITPWLVFAAVFAANLALWYVITVAVGGMQNLGDSTVDLSGSATWVFFFLLVMAIQSMSLTFRFALGIGMTRRDYYLGTVSYLIFLASTYAAGIALLSEIEHLTHGWGLGLRFFRPWFLADISTWQLWYLSTVMGLLLAMLGVAIGAVWVRWRATGVYLFIGALALLIIVAAWLMTVTQAWGSLGDYLGNHTPTIVATWMLPIAASCGAGGYLVLRRATPRA